MNLPGSRDSDEIDDENREGHVDFTERFDDIIQGGAAADPWVLKGSSLTARYHWSIGFPGTPSTGALGIGNSISPQANGAAVSVTVPIIVPKNSKLIGVKFRLQATGAGASASATVFKHDSTGAPSAVGSVANAAIAGTWSDYNIGTVAETALNGVSFYAVVNLANGTGTFGKFMDFEVSLEG